MANVLVNENSLQAIANAIREKTGANTTYTPAEMTYGIELIKAYTTEDEGKVVNNGELIEQTSKIVTENGRIDTTTNNLIYIDVPTSSETSIIPFYVLENGVYTAPTGTAYSPVTVNVPTGSETSVLPLSVSENGTYNAPEGIAYNPITVNVSGGSVSVPQRNVNFYDYDGTIVYSYSTSDFLNLLSMPSNPTHAGLTAQGWNWSLVDAKAYVNDCGKLNIGQMYITDDGKTRIYIHLNEGRTSPMLGICPNGTVDVDWGDGTAHDTLAGTSTSTVKWTPNHAYAAPGDYVIKLTVTGSAGFYGVSTSNAYSGILRYSSNADGRNQPYQNSVQKIEAGSGVTSISDWAFYNCSVLTSVTIPNSVTSIGRDAFRGCSGLASVTIPNSVTSISDWAFYNCTGLTSVTIPNSVTSIGNIVFYNCTGLTSVTIPNSVTSIGSSVFRACTSLTSVTIPNSVVSIDSSVFKECTSLTSVTIPNSVTSIGSNAFSDCSGIGLIHFIPTTPPTVSNADAFTNIPTDCKIYVPTGLLAAYQSAANYPDPSIYEYIEE